MKMTNYSALVFSLGDIHGAVTFTLAYTLDKNLISSNSFHLILFSEAVLIILTVIFQFILTKKSDEEKEKAIDQVKEKMVNYALDALQNIYLPKKLRK